MLYDRKNNRVISDINPDDFTDHPNKNTGGVPWPTNEEVFNEWFEAIYPVESVVKCLLMQLWDNAALQSTPHFIHVSTDIEKLTESINKLQASFESYLKTTGQG